jgi:conjugal transfer pilus assembly protein TraW
MMSQYLRMILLFISAYFACATVFARDLGVVGDVYDILEEDLLKTIEDRYNGMKQTGEWGRLQTTWQKQVVSYADRPTPVSGVSVTQAARSFMFDPTITLSRDILDASGQVVAPVGTVVNPLSKMSLHKTLLFIDADDDRQLAWAMKIDKQLEGRTKWILVKGSVSAASNKIQRPVYFDQGGKIVSHFHIEHVPAKLYQEELHIKIEECLP